MCGIAGSLGPASSNTVSVATGVQRMVAALVHRGPDDAGVWVDDREAVGLGNRRLAILDVSTAGHQPMHSASGRYVVTLNGEIYNHAALTAALEARGEAPAWRGASDTERLLACLDARGIDATFEACVGMFAVAIWDRHERRLTLVRDRLGEKPLYYARFGGAWLFGSEVKALAAHPRFRQEIDPQALASYMSLGYVPAPAGILVDLRKVLPGRMVTLDAASDRVDDRAYWSIGTAAARPKTVYANDVEAVDALEALMARAVSEQMVADRPLGALLSGGVDSSSVVALMCAARTSRIKTFSIGFQQSSYNEAHFAARVASHFGTEHTELYVNANDVRDTIPSMPRIYDEPFADISQIPTYLVSRLASQSVTIALTGDGGDELFGGYPRYAMGARLWPALRRLPRAWRSAGGRLLSGVPDAVDHAFARAFPHDEDSGVRGLRPAQKMGKLGRAVRSDDLGALYWQLLAPWGEPTLLARDLRWRAPEPSPLADGADAARRSVEEQFMLCDLAGYLPDDILTKIDRASMAVGLESRAPLLDHRIVEFALRLPQAMKFRRGVSKWLLRQVLHRHIPQALVDRPKMGFNLPMASWLRGPLRPWAHDLIATSRGDLAQMLDLRALRSLLDRHASGTGDWHQPLWTALMFLNWAQAMERPHEAHAAPPASLVAAGVGAVPGTAFA